MQNKIISADSHFNEPADFYTSRISKKFKGLAPKVVNISNKSYWKFQNILRPIGLDNLAGVKNNKLKRYCRYSDFEHFDLEKRKQIVKKDNILHEVMLPSGGLLYTSKNEELTTELFNLYNNFCVQSSDNFYSFIPMLPSENNLAKIILKKILKTNKTQAVLMPIYPGGGFYSNKKYDKLFKMLNYHKYTVIMHAGGVRCLPKEKLNYSQTGFKNSIMIYQGMETFSDLFFSGMLSKYKNIKFVFSEIGVSWLSGFFERVSYCYGRYKSIDGYKFENLEVGLKNIYFSFQQDFPQISNKNVSFKNYLFGSDFPHAESVFPNSKRKYLDVKKIYGRKIVENFFYNNAKKLYNIDI